MKSRNRGAERLSPRKPKLRENNNITFSKEVFLNSQRVLVLVAFLLIGGGGLYWFSKEDKDTSHSQNPVIQQKGHSDIPVPQEKPPIETSENFIPPANIEKMEQLIPELEKGFAIFEKDIITKIKTKNLGYGDQLLMAFKLMKHNRDANKNRNGPGEVSKHKNLPADTRGTLEDPSFFFYSFNPNGNNFIATFSPLDRMINLQENYDPKNLFHNLVLYHELNHAYDDLAWRNTLTDQAKVETYIDFHQSSKLMINSEFRAYAAECELLNILTERYIEDTALSSQKFDIEKILQQLKATEKDKAFLESLLMIARAYFLTKNGRVMSNDDNFERLIAKIYSNQIKNVQLVWVKIQDGQVTTQSYP